MVVDGWGKGPNMMDQSEALRLLADKNSEIERLSTEGEIRLSLLREAEALLCDCRAGRVANRLALRMQEHFASVSTQPDTLNDRGSDQFVNPSSEGENDCSEGE